MKVALATLCLNEEEFLARNYFQHREWPGLVSWVFVEGADKKYVEASPELVTPEGLSTDKTSEYLKDLASADSRVTYIPYGWMIDANEAQAKTKGRDRYLTVFEEVKPDIFVVIDGDEFYTREDQERINRLVSRDLKNLSWRFTQRHLWKPPALSGSNRFRFEVVGGYWAVPHVRVFRWAPGIRYLVSHNWPSGESYDPIRRLYNGIGGDPQCVHLGFTREGPARAATHRYYEARGEGRTDHRSRYVACRRAWETWIPGQSLPDGAKIVPYSGPKPEAYR